MPEPTFTAYLDWDDAGLSVLVNRTIPAGISGPFGEVRVVEALASADAPNLETLLGLAAVALARAGYLTGAWSPYRNGFLTCDLIHIGEETGANVAASMEAVGLGSDLPS